MARHRRSEGFEAEALVTVAAGAVRTVRAPGRFERIGVGRRVAVQATRLADGTFRARAVRAGAPAKMHCRRLDGAWRMEYLKSETAEIKKP